MAVKSGSSCTDGLLCKLESFLGELAKRVLRWPKYHSNTAAVTVLDLPSDLLSQ